MCIVYVLDVASDTHVSTGWDLKQSMAISGACRLLGQQRFSKFSVGSTFFWARSSSESVIHGSMSSVSR